MVRTRLAALALAVGLMLVSGCAELSSHSWFGWCRGSSCEADCGAAGFDGPVLEQGGPFVGQPAYPTAPVTPPGTSPEVMPQLSAPPRLVPQPQQAQPAPYTPSYRSRTVSQ